MDYIAKVLPLMVTTPFANTAAENSGLVDSQCTGDYVEIPSSMSRSCGALFGQHYNAVNTRYCGCKFGVNFQATVGTQSTSSSVCDCSEPFSVTVHFDDLSDVGALNTANGNQNNILVGRGVCLDYKQTPCYS